MSFAEQRMSARYVIWMTVRGSFTSGPKRSMFVAAFTAPERMSRSTEELGMSKTDEQNRRGLQRALRGVSEGLAMQAPDSEYVRSLSMYRMVLCETLGVPESAWRPRPPASSPPGDEPQLAV